MVKEVTYTVKEVAFTVKEVTFQVREVTFLVKEMISSTRKVTSLTSKVKYLVSFFSPFSPKFPSKTKKQQSLPINPAKIIKTCFSSSYIKMLKTALI